MKIWKSILLSHHEPAVNKVLHFNAIIFVLQVYGSNSCNEAIIEIGIL